MKNYDKYKRLCWLSIIFPFNRWYIGSNKKILRSFTLNLFFCGWFFDLFYRQQKFDEAMAKRGFMNTDIRNNQGA
ncbi:protein of unknown function [Oenococcus oeni]|uniref:hypothetical protein n=1 Tax=Oenococcus oeni TaxID=1247 RepID=UPI00107C965D|nr:hypothetical protein [Oenococcus oeni]AVI93419.1 hypothetical protein AX764_00425 [Oenococcus oeni]SYV98421.1 hypothetical protein OENI_10025 [Oenococcus oeni]SYW03673.1 hypothetical protein OENI_430007 [Oenococcus oeni]SYW18880.1 hypothetical protein OENI_60025 [Oenococcus oeni]VDC13817.1 protein of unknown function [Oenococcus oeni]